MEWQEISSAETAAAGNAPEMVDDTIYESLYAELKTELSQVNIYQLACL